MPLDEGEQDKLMIKLTNHLTGEITEVEVTSAEAAKNLLIELKASYYVLGKAMDSLKSYLDRFLGQDQEYSFADGKMLKRIQRTVLKYRVESVKEVFENIEDEDNRAAALEAVLKVDSSTVNALVQEMMEKGELPMGALKQIREQADQQTSKPYIEVR